MNTMIVTEISWDDMFDGQPLPESPTHAAWHTAVAEVAAKAQTALPEANGRIDRARELVLAGCVTRNTDGSFTVQSQTDHDTCYTVHSVCSCPDAEQGQQCKHLLATWIWRKAQRLVEPQHDTPGDEPHQLVSEEPQRAAMSPIDIAPQFIVDIQGKAFVQFAGLLALAHARGLVSLTADFIMVTADLALAHAVARFTDGRTFEESGDATPDNVNKKVRPHFARMALTRAKARALRDALNINMVSLEELAE
jgi:hypothetical protein